MRHHIAGLAFVLLASGGISTASNAADMAGPAPPVLRGVLPASEQALDWSGFYFGGTGAYTNTNNTSAGSNGVPVTVAKLAQGTVLGQDMQGRYFPENRREQSSSVAFGAFVGYNFVVDDTVFGLELDYTRGKAKGEVSTTGGGRYNETPPNLPLTPGVDRSWGTSTQDKFNITDFGSVRARVGYAWGNALPYLTGGVAVMRGGFETNGVVTSTLLNATTMAVIGQGATLQDSQKTSSKLFFGYALGAGIDYALTQNVFLRAELQHFRFANVNGFNIALNQARVGAAVKY